MEPNFRVGFISGTEAVKACILVNGCFDEFVAPGYSDEGKNEFKKFANPLKMQERLASGSFALSAENDAEIVGIIEVRDFNHISLLFVKKEFHRMGIAKKLFESALDICKRNIKGNAVLKVNSSPYAVEVYEKLGFVTEGDEAVLNGIRFIPMVYKIQQATGVSNKI